MSGYLLDGNSFRLFVCFLYLPVASFDWENWAMFCMCRAMFEGSSGVSTGAAFSSSSGAVAGDVCGIAWAA